MKKPLFLIAMMLGIASFAQNTYTLSTYTSTYTELTNATPVNIIEEGEGEHWDDPLFFIDLDFGFPIGGSTYNSLIQFGDGAAFLIGNINYEDTTLTSSIVHFFGMLDDFVDGADAPESLASEITHNTTGDIGNRITKIEYKDAAFYEEVYGMEPSAENRMNFQLWFYENDGIMEVHFGESNITDPALVFYENPGPSMMIATDIDFEDENEGLSWAGLVIGNPATPTLLQGNFDIIEDGSLNGIPESGRVYRFSPSGSVGIANAETPAFSIYPTLVQNQIWVKDPVPTNAVYRIIDIAGKQVKTGSLTGNNPLDASDLNAGLYIFSIDGMANAVKFVKE